jgi:hypothetical protein
MAIDIQAFEAELQQLALKVLEVEKEAHRKQKELCDKLNNQKLDEVIHELFTKDDILKFLSSASIPTGVVKKNVLKEAIEKAVNEYKLSEDRELLGFKFLFLDKIGNLDEDEASDREIATLSKEIATLVKKYGIEFDEKTGVPTDPRIIGLFYKFNKTLHISKSISPNISIKITHSSGKDILSSIKAEVESSEFDSWVAEHFLVKDVDGQPGMATFELVY